MTAVKKPCLKSVSRATSLLLWCLLCIVTAGAKALGSMTLLSGLPSLDQVELPRESPITQELKNRIICGNDPVNNCDPRGGAPLSLEQIARGQQALRSAFEYADGQPGYLSRFTTLDEFQREARKVFRDAAGVFPEVHGQLSEAYAAADSFVNKLEPSWSAQRRASDAQKAAEDRARDNQNAAYRHATDNFPKILGYGYRLGAASLVSFGTNLAGFDVTVGLQYSPEKGNYGYSWGTEEISGGQQAMAIGMLFLPEFKSAKIVTQGHHPIPKFLGGNQQQLLTLLGPSVHNEFHLLLRKNLKDAGIPLNVGGRGGGAADWARYFNANPGSQRTALDAVLDSARSIDYKYGTQYGPQVTRDFWQNVLDGNFQTFP
jgi:hypothetical protein